MIDRKKIETEFKNYISNYDVNDSKIDLKIVHTYKVANLCEAIAKSIDFSDDDVSLAWMCGMLHDIGRFEQVKRYGTFNDRLSVDHAQFGADLLFKEGLFERITGLDNTNNNTHDSINECTSEYAAIVEKAIRAHNMFRIPEELTEREKAFATILRDADKIDILRANCMTPREEIYNVTTEELIKSDVSPDVKKAFMDGQCPVRRKDNTPADHIVGHICFVFELVYPLSRKLLFEQGYIYQILDFKSENPDTKAWFEYMKTTIKPIAGINQIHGNSKCNY